MVSVALRNPDPEKAERGWRDRRSPGGRANLTSTPGEGRTAQRGAASPPGSKLHDYVVGRHLCAISFVI